MTSREVAAVHARIKFHFRFSLPQSQFKQRPNGDLHSNSFVDDSISQQIFHHRINLDFDKEIKAESFFGYIPGVVNISSRFPDDSSYCYWAKIKRPRRPDLWSYYIYGIANRRQEMTSYTVPCVPFGRR